MTYSTLLNRLRPLYHVGKRFLQGARQLRPVERIDYQALKRRHGRPEGATFIAVAYALASINQGLPIFAYRNMKSLQLPEIDSTKRYFIEENQVAPSMHSQNRLVPVEQPHESLPREIL